ncbi:hypothetical protein C2869_00550 [Saccharobesus litoralis]|uniref:YfaZ n=1 Tax=Saccharobesus litoralis TaxID=2172099 RepID=A0A2S0VLE4_9ALTE|nr:YfaZ family outer membrane protein [Saccharobesus litoralis]AWB65021.1 hypothetical protein C2869_00550 [Saccharobesus litoralis]
MDLLKKTFITALTLAASITGVAQAQNKALDLALSNKTAKISYGHSGIGSENSYVQASYFHHDEDADLADIAFLVGKAQNMNNLLVGGKVFYGSVGDADGGGLAIGAQGQYKLAAELYLRGQAYYAPQVVSFGDAENYVEVEARLSYQLMPEAEVSLGYRDISVDIKDSPVDAELHSGGFLALTLKF